MKQYINTQIKHTSSSVKWQIECRYTNTNNVLTSEFMTIYKDIEYDVRSGKLYQYLRHYITSLEADIDAGNTVYLYLSSVLGITFPFNLCPSDSTLRLKEIVITRKYPESVETFIFEEVK